MNEVHLQQIFTNYIDRFEEFNSEDPQKPSEYYKWTMPKPFKESMDKALNAKNKDDFNAQMSEIGKVTRDFIDSRKTMPFAGLVKLANDYEEWENVQKLFQELYEEDNGDLETRQGKIESFLEQAYQLKEKHNLSDLYKSDFRSATVYLFLYDPDHNYIYKPTHAQDFQDCIEFYDDFGEGNHVRLKTYYRMCDQLVEAIKKNPEIQETKQMRLPKFKDTKNVYEDKEQHILAYDIIYCCSAYDLFRGITFKRLTPKERQIMWEKQQEAKRLFEELKAAQEKQKTLDTAMNELEEWFCVGKAIAYKGFGKDTPVENGVITKRNKGSITVEFDGGTERCLGLFDSIVNGYIHPKEIENNALAGVVEILKNKSSIEISLSNAERNFAPYSDYL